MTFQVLPVSGWVGNAFGISCLEPGNVDGMGNENEFRTQSKINPWSILLSQTVSFMFAVRPASLLPYVVLFYQDV